MQISWKEVVELAHQSRAMQLDYWLYESLFSFSWWILLVTTLGLLIPWIIILDKKRIFEIVSFGFLVSSLSTMLDALGVVLMLWDYKHTLTPIAVPIEIHVVIMPIIYMIIYQYFSKWKGFFIAITVNAVFFTFMLEPLLVRLQVYELYHWKHYYSFLPYILIGVLFKYAIQLVKQRYK